MKIDNITIHGGNQKFEGKPNKVIIEDVVRKMKGEQEDELNPTDSIRFVIGSAEYSIRIKDDRLHIHKDENDGRKSSQICVASVVKNVIEVF